ncbi:MAG: Holliday junction resolvase RuvX [Actinobacteria bacterium]|nr:Holliday junction resolvase RuvX [Actinomycetota bacterium]
MRMIGLDVGDKRVGVAVSDHLGKTAQPLETLERGGGFMERLAGLIRDTGAERLVVGLPLLMDGREGEQARKVRRFTRGLEESLDVPVVLLDERLTSREARTVLEAGGFKRRRGKGATDRVAAALILRAYMDGLPEE